MAGGGRPRKPTKLHLLQGTKRKNRHGKHEEPTPPEAKGAQPPPWLDESAQEKWREIAPILEAVHVLTEADRDTLANYCAAFSMLMAAEKSLEEHGSVTYETTTESGGTMIRAHPAVAIKAEAMRLMRAHGAVLGLDPASRTKIHAPVKKPESAKGFFFGKKAQSQG